MPPVTAALIALAAATTPGPLDHLEARLLIDCPGPLAWHPVSPNVMRAAVEAAVSEGWCDRREFEWRGTPGAVVLHAAECRAWCRGLGPEFTPAERDELRRRAALEQDRAAGLLEYAGWLKGRRAPAAAALCWPDWFKCHRRRAATDYRAAACDGPIVPRDYYRIDP